MNDLNQIIKYIDNYKCLYCFNSISYQSMLIADAECGECLCRRTLCVKHTKSSPKQHVIDFAINFKNDNLIKIDKEFSVMISIKGDDYRFFIVNHLMAPEQKNPVARVLTVFLIDNKYITLKELPDFFFEINDYHRLYSKLSDLIVFA